MIRRVVALGLLAAVAAGLWLEVGSRRGPAGGKVIVLLVTETNRSALAYAPSGDRRARWRLEEDESAQLRLRLRPEDLPGPGTRLLVLHHVSGAGVRLHQAVYRLDRLPAVVPVAREVHWSGTVLDGGRLVSVNLVNNATRVVAGDLAIVAVLPEGTVELSYGGQTFRLPPEDLWEQLRVREDGGVSVFGDGGPEWSAALRRAMAWGLPATKLSVEHLGIWDRSRIGAGGP